MERNQDVGHFEGTDDQVRAALPPHPGQTVSVPPTPMKLKIAGPALPNIPWQAKPAGNPDIMWRYDANPVVGRRPLPRVTGIYNSAVVPWQL